MMNEQVGDAQPRSKFVLRTDNLKLDKEAGAVPECCHIRSKREDEGDNVCLPDIDLTNCPFISKPFCKEADEDDSSEGEQLSKIDEEYHSPMDDPPLKDQPVVETVEDDEDLAPHLREPEIKPGEPNPENKPKDFSLEPPLETPNPTIKGLPPDKMIDRTFLMPPQPDGTRLRAKIVEKVNATKKKLQKHPEMIKFWCRVNNKCDEIVECNDVVDYIEQDQTWDGMWKFKEILDHKKVSRKDPEYKGCSFNCLIEWETGEKTWEPLHMQDKQGVYDTDPVTVAIYARKHGLLNTPGWKLPGLKKRAKTQQRIIRAANQAKLASFHRKPKYMYGILVPINYEQAMQFDKENENTKWADCT